RSSGAWGGNPARNASSSHPRERRRGADDELYAHFLTFSVVHRRRLLDQAPLQRIVLGVLNDQPPRPHAICAGFVILPDHVQAIVGFPQRGQLSRFLHPGKRRSRRGIRAWYAQAEAQDFREFGLGQRFWQPKCSSFSSFRRRKLEAKLAYGHAKPVG